MPSVRLEGITKAYGGKKALDHVSFTASGGRRTVIIGASGAGKTTILRLIAGFEAPDEGTLLIDEKDAAGISPSARGIGMIFQDGALFPHSTVFENISYGLYRLGYQKEEIRRMTEETAEKLHIRDLLNRYPASLSAGERQRTGIARALVRKPGLMLLDEPFANLDVRLKEELLQEIISLQEENGITMIHVTHDQSEALAAAENLIVMEGGRILDAGDPERIINDPKDLKAAMFLGTPALNILAAEVRDGRLHCFGRTFAVPTGFAGHVTAAVRPEHLYVSEDGIMCRVTGVVQRFADRILECESMYGAIRTLSAGNEQPGSTIRLAFDEKDLMLFDAATGKRVRI
ncbi:MAG: ABC transporter ATP-binding protein [Solobacterium sp.]|nr:ABC transporter ATP-binding protein [Solobacterium sp.]